MNCYHVRIALQTSVYNKIGLARISCKCYYVRIALQTSVYTKSGLARISCKNMQTI